MKRELAWIFIVTCICLLPYFAIVRMGAHTTHQLPPPRTTPVSHQAATYPVRCSSSCWIGACCRWPAPPTSCGSASLPSSPSCSGSTSSSSCEELPHDMPEPCSCSHQRNRLDRLSPSAASQDCSYSLMAQPFTSNRHVLPSVRFGHHPLAVIRKHIALRRRRLLAIDSSADSSRRPHSTTNRSQHSTVADSLLTLTKQASGGVLPF